MAVAPGSEGAHAVEGEPYLAGSEAVEAVSADELRLLRTMVADRKKPQGTVPEDLDITLEFVRYHPYAITLIITNHSNYNIRYGDGFEISCRTWGHGRGEADNESFDLPAGEVREISVLHFCRSGFSLGFGEFRLTKNITVEHESPSVARSYKLHTDFAIENTDIPPDMSGLAIEVYLATPIGAHVNIVNGLDGGRLYYDKSFQLQRRIDDSWQDLPTIASDAFPDENMRSLASRQILQYYTIYWAWLYGELPEGQYRLMKSFWHRADDGDITSRRLYAEFLLDGEPVPDMLRRDDGSSWGHWFGGISTFRAEVIEFVDDSLLRVQRGNNGLLVNGLTCVWGGDREGGHSYIWDNVAVAVFDSNGVQMRFSDIKQGMTVEITHSGYVVLSYPGQIIGALLIRICE
jgi:hypothetical protein